jgi:hypothetical protein
VSSTQLRPLGVGEILDVAIKAYSKNARTLITIGALVGIPFELLSGLIQLSTVSSSDQVSGVFTFQAGTTNVDYTRARVAGTALTLLIGAVVTLVLTAATVKAVSDAYLGSVPSVRDSLRFAARRVGSLFWLYLVLAIGLTVAFVFLVVPAIWLYVAWSVATPVLLVEGLGGTAALRRSFRLVRGRWWPVAFTLVVARFLVSFVSGVVLALFLIVPHAIDGPSILLAVIGSTIAGAVTVAVVQPLEAAIVTILYFDLRVRKDGFDVALLAAGLGLPEAELPLYALPPRALAPVAQGGLGLAGGGEAPPFWPPPPGWKPSSAPPSGWTPSAPPPPPSGSNPPAPPPPSGSNPPPPPSPPPPSAPPPPPIDWPGE